jgi:hypothetical protein
MADLTDVIIDGDPYDEDEQGGWEALINDTLSKFVNLSDGLSPAYTGDLDDIAEISCYNCNGDGGVLHAPEARWGFVSTYIHCYSTAYRSQVWITMPNGDYDPEIYTRARTGSTWTEWRKMPSSVFTGATASADGVSGTVPQPLAGDQNKFLTGGGQWEDDTANLITNYTTQDDSTTTDIITPSGGETAISTLESGANHARLFNKISRCFLNVRKLINTVKRVWNTVANSWALGETYAVGDIRLWTNGHTYVCKLTHTSSSSITPANTTYWDDKTLGDMITQLNSNKASSWSSSVSDVIGFQSNKSEDGAYIIAMDVDSNTLCVRKDYTWNYYKLNTGWKPITFTGTYQGTLQGFYNDTIGIISYQAGQSGSGNYNLTINVKAKITLHSALRDSGYLQVNANGDFTIQGAVNWTVGEIVFPIK